MLPDCYSTAHSSAFNKIGARLPEAREFILSCGPTQNVSWNAQKAFQNRWYGNATEAVCSQLTRHFMALFNRVPGQILLLRRFLRGPDSSLSLSSTIFTCSWPIRTIVGRRVSIWPNASNNTGSRCPSILSRRSCAGIFRLPWGRGAPSATPKTS